jgi:ketosteroid isomerase-like protein
MKLSTRLICATAVISLGLAASPVMAEDNPAVASEVMAVARAKWAAEMAQRPIDEQMASIAEDYTEFNSDHPTLIRGRALNGQFYEAWAAGPTSLVGDMQNPHVQVYGDTAILTYNYVGLVRSREGDITPSNAKSTRVYVRQDGSWMLVHANFNPIVTP